MVSERIPTAGEVERALVEVYSRPEFAPREPSRLAVWVADLWSALKKFVAGLFPDIRMTPEAGRALFWILIAVLVVVAVLIAVHLAGTVLGLWRARDLSRGGAGAPVAGHERPRAEAWERAARAAAAEGRWRDAAHALYAALLLRLEEAGAVHYDASKTPGEYRREARGRTELSRALDAFLRLFEPIAFGGRAIDGPGYERLKAAAAEGGARA